MTAQQLDDLLRASLELWQCAAVLAPRSRDDTMQAPLEAWLVLPDGTSLAVIEAAPDDEPFHWWLQWHGQGAPGAGPGGVSTVPAKVGSGGCDSAATSPADSARE